MKIKDGELPSGATLEYQGKKYVYLGTDPEKGNNIFRPLEEENNG
jgi:hypothetical protein